MTTANRGKEAETKVRKKLQSMEAANCAHMRMPDTHSGSRVPTLSDFIFCKEGRLNLLEVKQVAHSYRLPHKNFAPDQIARMRNWQAAGAQAVVVIYFTPEEAWRVKPVDWFLQKDGGSWNFEGTPLLTLEEVFLKIA